MWLLLWLIQNKHFQHPWTSYVVSSRLIALVALCWLWFLHVLLEFEGSKNEHCVPCVTTPVFMRRIQTLILMPYSFSCTKIWSIQCLRALGLCWTQHSQCSHPFQNNSCCSWVPSVPVNSFTLYTRETCSSCQTVWQGVSAHSFLQFIRIPIEWGLIFYFFFFALTLTQ